MSINITLSIILFVFCIAAVGALVFWLAGKAQLKPWAQIFLALFAAFLVFLIVKIT